MNFINTWFSKIIDNYEIPQIKTFYFNDTEVKFCDLVSILLTHDCAKNQVLG